ncbi:MAG: hypothetical protein ACLFV4_06440 [Candidatus Hydrogenedentota bacterium]
MAGRSVSVIDKRARLTSSDSPPGREWHRIVCTPVYQIQAAASLDGAGIYDLGEAPPNKVREAIRESYKELGYGGTAKSGEEMETPRFRRFYEILKGNENELPQVWDFVHRFIPGRDRFRHRAVGRLWTVRAAWRSASDSLRENM